MPKKASAENSPDRNPYSSSPGRGPARRERFAEEVAGELREMILSGRLALGERIDQDALAAAHNMSRLPVREALIALEQEGLVINTTRRGAYVAELQPEDVLDQYEVYGLVAGIAAARAAERLSADELRSLRAAHEAFVRAKGGAAQQKANEEFHRIINRVSSSRLKSSLALLARSLPSHHYMFDSTWAKLAIAHHEKVLEAIEHRDADAARAAMLTHLVASGRQAVTALGSKGFWPTESGLQKKEKLPRTAKVASFSPTSTKTTSTKQRSNKQGSPRKASTSRRQPSEK